MFRFFLFELDDGEVVFVFVHHTREDVLATAPIGILMCKFARHDKKFLAHNLRFIFILVLSVSATALLVVMLDNLKQWSSFMMIDHHVLIIRDHDGIKDTIAKVNFDLTVGQLIGIHLHLGITLVVSNVKLFLNTEFLLSEFS